MVLDGLSCLTRPVSKSLDVPTLLTPIPVRVTFESLLEHLDFTTLSPTANIS